MVADVFGAQNKVSKSGDTMTGTLILIGETPLQMAAGAAAGRALICDNQGRVSWGTIEAGGGVSIGTNAGALQPLGTAAAGTTGLAADVGHVHPPTGVALLTGATFTGPVEVGGALAASASIVAGVTSLTYGASISLDASLANHFRVILAGNATLASPVNPSDGQAIRVEVIQDSTGGRTLAYGAAFAFGTDLPAPQLSSGPNERDILAFIYNEFAQRWWFVGKVGGFANAALMIAGSGGVALPKPRLSGAGNQPSSAYVRLPKPSLAGSGVSSGSGAITNGSQLVGQLAGPGTTNVGPNALLNSSSYPLPTYTGTSVGPLQQVPLPSRGYWLIDGADEITDICAFVWGSTTQVYVNNNTATNKGGIVPSGGMTIDGYPVPAGTYVFQFLDFSTDGNSGGNLYFESGGPHVLFRGCRFRAGSYAAPGVFNSETGGFANDLYIHYCDAGGSGPSLADCATVAIDVEAGANLRVLRNYISYVSTGVQPNMGTFCDVIENFIEKITLADPTWHLNGISVNGGNPNFRILRNHIVIAATDEDGNAITQTDCISMYQDNGTFPGTGTNSDGTTGYFISGNYVGGTGYCFYLGQNAGTAPTTVEFLTFENNLVTTSVYATGGANGTVAAVPTWSPTYHNVESGNNWADGPNAGISFA